jgi:DNA polymerase II small subunit/DNA polymerase delta subunit B
VEGLVPYDNGKKHQSLPQPAIGKGRRQQQNEKGIHFYGNPKTAA